MLKQKKGYKFLKPGKLKHRELELVITKQTEADPIKKYVPAYHFIMRNAHTGEKIGDINFRVDNTNLLKFGGHLGYNVKKKFRGNRLASRSVKLLLPFIKKHGLKKFWITCNPENIASRKTCIYAGGKLVGIYNLPKDNEMYKLGDRKKCRYLFRL